MVTTRVRWRAKELRAAAERTRRGYNGVCGPYDTLSTALPGGPAEDACPTDIAAVHAITGTDPHAQLGPHRDVVDKARLRTMLRDWRARS